MPSKAPSAVTHGRRSGGEDARPRSIRMEEAFGLEEGAAPDADAEERSIRAVDADEARRARLRHRLAVREGAGGLLRESSRRHGLEDRVRGKRARPQQLAVPRR